LIGDAARAEAERKTFSMTLKYGLICLRLIACNISLICWCVGAPDLFVTLAPADSGDIAVSVYAGYVATGDMSALDPAAWPTTVLRATIPTKNAWAACLRFEQKVCCCMLCGTIVVITLEVF
jgi:hypothetical protein